MLKLQHERSCEAKASVRQNDGDAPACLMLDALTRSRLSRFGVHVNGPRKGKVWNAFFVG